MRTEIEDVLKKVDKHLEAFIVTDKDDALTFLDRLSSEMS